MTRYINNIPTHIGMNQPLRPGQVSADTTLEAIEGKLGRLELHMDMTFQPGDEQVAELVRVLGRMELESKGSDELIPVEVLLSNVAAHAAEIMGRTAPCKLKFHSVPGLSNEGVTVEIEPSRTQPDPNSNVPFIWDQCKVNGIDVGNRSGAVHAYVMLMAPALVEYYRIPAAVHRHRGKPSEENYYDRLREKLYKTAQR